MRLYVIRLIVNGAEIESVANRRTRSSNSRNSSGNNNVLCRVCDTQRTDERTGRKRNGMRWLDFVSSMSANKIRIDSCAMEVALKMIFGMKFSDSTFSSPKQGLFSSVCVYHCCHHSWNRYEFVYVVLYMGALLSWWWTLCIVIDLMVQIKKITRERHISLTASQIC